MMTRTGFTFPANVTAVAALGLFDWLVNWFAFHPYAGPHVDPHRVDSTIQEVFFDASDGVRLQAFFVPRPESERVILFFHGNAGNASHRLEDAVRLADLGANVLLLSYRGYGRSEGSPSERGVYTDGRSALRYVQSQLGFSLEHTLIVGRSLGSAVAIDVARNLPVAGLVLVSAFSSGRDVARVQGLSALAWVTGEPFASIEKIPHVVAPVLFIHGEQDEIVPMSLGRKLFARCRSAKTWTLIPGAGHNDLIRRAGAQYWNAIREFMDAASPP